MTKLGQLNSLLRYAIATLNVQLKCVFKMSRLKQTLMCLSTQYFCGITLHWVFSYTMLGVFKNTYTQ